MLASEAAMSTIYGSSQWDDLCAQGFTSDAAGCFGNVNSAAFQNVNADLGSFLTNANINSGDVDNSLFVKQFFGGSQNVPQTSRYIAVTVGGAKGKCALFTESGAPIYANGIFNIQPTSGNVATNGQSSGKTYALSNTQATTINLTYAKNQDESTTTATNAIYLVCVGYKGDSLLPSAIPNATAV